MPTTKAGRPRPGAKLRIGEIHAGTLAAAFDAGLALVAPTQLGAAWVFARAVCTD